MGNGALDGSYATAAFLLDVTDENRETEVREYIDASGARILNLHLWRVGPGPHPAIVSVSGGIYP